MRRTWGKAFLALTMAMSLALTACSSKTAADPTAPKTPAATKANEEKPLGVGMGGIADTLDPHMSTSSLATAAYWAMFDTLVTVDEKAVVQPALAQSWKNLDPTTWEFKLRTGVKFHNGEAFDANTSKFNLERVLNDDTKSPLKGRITTIKEIQVVDAATLKVVTLQPDPILDRRLSAIFMIPAGYYKEAGKDGFLQKPVGTGPFKFKEFVKGDRLVVDAYPEAWRGAPKVKSVIFRALPEATTRVSALRTGEIDIVHNLPADQVEPLKKDGFQISYAPQSRTMILSLNTTRGGPLADKRVRQAMNYAVDKEAIIKSIMGGNAKLGKAQLIGPDGFGHNPNLQPYPYDVAKAKELLKEAGYEAGFTVNMTGTQGFYVNDKEWQEAVIGYLGKVGIKVAFKTVENAVYVPMIYESKHADIFPFAPNYYPAQDADFALVWFTTNNSAKLYANKQFDDLFAKSRTEMDKQAREKILWQMAEIMREDPIAIYLFQPPELLAVSAKVKGFQARPDLVVAVDQVTK